jgi:hypothetical protein
MLPTKLLIFGSPKAGTPVMTAAPSTALDLMRKRDHGGPVWVHGKAKRGQRVRWC